MQKTAYEIRISDWSSDVCSSDLYVSQLGERLKSVVGDDDALAHFGHDDFGIVLAQAHDEAAARHQASRVQLALDVPITMGRSAFSLRASIGIALYPAHGLDAERSEEHTSELQSLMRISYAVFCLKKKRKTEIPKKI